MVLREVEGIEVFEDGDDGVEVVVVCICRRGEAGFDDLAGDGNGVRGLKVEFAGEVGED